MKKFGVPFDKDMDRTLLSWRFCQQGLDWVCPMVDHVLDMIKKLPIICGLLCNNMRLFFVILEIRCHGDLPIRNRRIFGEKHVEWLAFLSAYQAICQKVE